MLIARYISLGFAKENILTVEKGVDFLSRFVGVCDGCVGVYLAGSNWGRVRLVFGRQFVLRLIPRQVEQAVCDGCQQACQVRPDPVNLKQHGRKLSAPKDIQFLELLKQMQ